MATEFLLERLVHQVLKGDNGHKLIAQALIEGTPAGNLLLDILWPTIECLHQLHHDRIVGVRIYNSAVRSLAIMIDQVSLRLPQHYSAACARSLLLLCAPGDSDELGAQLLAKLASSHGFTVHLAGRNLAMEEVVFAVGQLQPNAIVMHGSALARRDNTREFCRKLDQIGLRPRVQILVTGAVLDSVLPFAQQTAGDDLGADLAARHPVEALELLALCPHHRAIARVHSPDAASSIDRSAAGQFPAGSHDIGVSPDLIRELVQRHFKMLLNPN